MDTLFEQIRAALIKIISNFIKITTFCSLKKKRIAKYSNTSTVLSSNLQEKKKSHIGESIGYIVSGTVKILRIHRDSPSSFKLYIYIQMNMPL